MGIALLSRAEVQAAIVEVLQGFPGRSARTELLRVALERHLRPWLQPADYDSVWADGRYGWDPHWWNVCRQARRDMVIDGRVEPTDSSGRCVWTLSDRAASAVPFKPNSPPANAGEHVNLTVPRPGGGLTIGQRVTRVLGTASWTLGAAGLRKGLRDLLAQVVAAIPGTSSPRLGAPGWVSESERRNGGRQPGVARAPLGKPPQSGVAVSSRWSVLAEFLREWEDAVWKAIPSGAPPPDANRQMGLKDLHALPFAVLESALEHGWIGGPGAARAGAFVADTILRNLAKADANGTSAARVLLGGDPPLLERIEAMRRWISAPTLATALSLSHIEELSAAVARFGGAESCAKQSRRGIHSGGPPGARAADCVGYEAVVDVERALEEAADVWTWSRPRHIDPGALLWSKVMGWGWFCSDKGGDKLCVVTPFSVRATDYDGKTAQWTTPKMLLGSGGPAHRAALEALQAAGDEFNCPAR